MKSSKYWKVVQGLLHVHLGHHNNRINIILKPPFPRHSSFPLHRVARTPHQTVQQGLQQRRGTLFGCRDGSGGVSKCESVLPPQNDLLDDLIISKWMSIKIIENDSFKQGRPWVFRASNSEQQHGESLSFRHATGRQEIGLDMNYLQVQPGETYHRNVYLESRKY